MARLRVSCTRSTPIKRSDSRMGEGGGGGRRRRRGGAAEGAGTEQDPESAWLAHWKIGFPATSRGPAKRASTPAKYRAGGPSQKNKDPQPLGGAEDEGENKAVRVTTMAFSFPPLNFSKTRRTAARATEHSAFQPSFADSNKIQPCWRRLDPFLWIRPTGRGRLSADLRSLRHDTRRLYRLRPAPTTLAMLGGERKDLGV